jgi:hypothetical protein
VTTFSKNQLKEEWEQIHVWRDQAACKDTDTRLFFPELHEPISYTVIELCLRCPVYEECQDWAIRHELHG